MRERGTARATLPHWPADAAKFAGPYRNGSETIELVVHENALFLKDDTTLFPILRSGTDLIARAPDGGTALRFALAQSARSGTWYLVTFERAFRVSTRVMWRARGARH